MTGSAAIRDQRDARASITSSKRYGTVDARRRPDVQRRTRRDVRPDRPGRRRQDDGDSAALRAAARRRRQHPRRSATIRSRSIARSPAKVGYLSQRFSLYGDLSIDENIAFFAEIHGVGDYAARRDRLLEMTQLTQFRDRLADQLSGGMKQKLALACTLVHEPEVILLDEPTTGVDPVSRREFWKLLSQFLAQRHHHPDVHAVSRRGRALLAHGAAARGPAARARSAGRAARQPAGHAVRGHRRSTARGAGRSRGPAQASPARRSSAIGCTSGSTDADARPRSTVCVATAARRRRRRRASGPSRRRSKTSSSPGSPRQAERQGRDGRQSS